MRTGRTSRGTARWTAPASGFRPRASDAGKGDRRHLATRAPTAQLPGSTFPPRLPPSRRDGSPTSPDGTREQGAKKAQLRPSPTWPPPLGCLTWGLSSSVSSIGSLSMPGMAAAGLTPPLLHLQHPHPAKPSPAPATTLPPPPAARRMSRPPSWLRYWFSLPAWRLLIGARLRLFARTRARGYWR